MVQAVAHLGARSFAAAEAWHRMRYERAGNNEDTESSSMDAGIGAEIFKRTFWYFVRYMLITER